MYHAGTKVVQGYALLSGKNDSLGMLETELQPNRQIVYAHTKTRPRKLKS